MKVWSALPLHKDEQEKGEDERPVYTHEDYIGLVLRSEAMMSRDYSTQSTSENPRMMAFFDSLVQREIEGWDSLEDTETQSSQSEPTSDESETGFPDFSHRASSIGTRRRMLMEQISVSIADDLIREDQAIAEAQNTGGPLHIVNIIMLH